MRLKLNKFEKNAIAQLSSEWKVALQKRAFDRTNFEFNMEYLDTFREIQTKLMKILDRPAQDLDDYIEKRSNHRWSLFKSKPHIEITETVNYIDKDTFEVITHPVNKDAANLTKKKLGEVFKQAQTLLCSKDVAKIYANEFANRKIKGLAFEENSSTENIKKTTSDKEETNFSKKEKNILTYFVTFSDNSILTYNPSEANALDKFKALFNKKLEELPSENQSNERKMMEKGNNCCRIF